MSYSTSSSDTWINGWTDGWTSNNWTIAYDTVHSILQTILDTIESTFQLIENDSRPATDRTDWAAVYRYFDENNISPYEDRHGGGDCGPEWPMDIEGHLTDYDGDLDI